MNSLFQRALILIIRIQMLRIKLAIGTISLHVVGLASGPTNLNYALIVSVNNQPLDVDKMITKIIMIYVDED